MPGLSENQRAVILTLIDTAPDSAIRSLNMALSAETHAEGPMAVIRDLVAVEARQRHARNLVFSPVTELCRSATRPPSRKTFPVATLRRLWQALQASSPAAVEKALAEAALWSPEDPVPEIFDALVMAAAAGLRDAAGTPFAAPAILLDEAEPGGAEVFAAYLDLAPLARDAVAKLPDWLGRMTGERAAAVRLAFRDATDIASDAAPRFFEILGSRLKEPWQILRIISAVMDRPHDGFLAASEIGYIGERILADMDACFEQLKGFDACGGVAAASAAAEAVMLIVVQVTEFEQTIDLKRDGPWGSRIANLKKLTAQKTEAYMERADKAVAEVLPVKPARFGGRIGRGAPKLDNPPKPESVAKAEALVAFIEKNRAAAATGGYANARAKVIEKLDERLDRYVEEVLDLLRDDEPAAEEEESARAHLDLAARLIGLLHDDKAAQIVRRRAAA